MPNKSSQDYQQDYTEPQLREKLKEKIKMSDKGGKSGQWSARKSQLLTKEYEKQGGDYKHKGHKTPTQKKLSQWTEENWQTADNSVAIKRKETVRYLPREIWEKLSEEEKTKTNAIKITGTKQGKQMIKNSHEVREMLKRTHAKHRQ